MDAAMTSLLFGLLQVLYIQAALDNGCYESQKGCCVRCNPGYLLSKQCGSCIPCPVRGYSDKPNDKPFCLHCQRCEGIFDYVQKCTSSRNAVCTCIPGKKCTDEKCTQCISDRCSAGEQLDGQKCMKCPPGTFNTGSEHICKPWKNCSSLGEVIISNGSHTTDVVCGGYLTKVTQSPGPSRTVTATTTHIRPVVGPSPVDSNVQIIYVVVSSAVVLALIVICVMFRHELTLKVKQIFQTIKQTEEEESCDYHSPVQEGGGEDEPMTLQA